MAIWARSEKPWAAGGYNRSLIATPALLQKTESPLKAIFSVTNQTTPGMASEKKVATIKTASLYCQNVKCADSEDNSCRRCG